jgi:GNAT superfamily N-acetyltransferase
VARDDGYVVRPGTVADVDVIAAHRRLMFAAMGAVAAEDGEALEAASRRYLAEALPAREYLAWLAEWEGVVVGGVGMVLRRLLPRPRHLDGGEEAYVLNVWVDEGHRGHGLATRLMREVMAWCATRGIRRVSLHASEQGRRVYERLGFTATNEMRREIP